MLPEIGKPARERMPTHVDDPGVREDQVDQWDMEPVVRHFVDEKGFCLMPVALHQLQILLAIGMQLVGRKSAKPRVIIVRPPSDLSRDERDISELLRSLDRRMARQDLLHES